MVTLAERVRRAQFLKGVGAAVVATSVLSGIEVSPSVAVARGSKGTAAERNTAKEIVRSSEQLKTLEHDQEHEVGKPGNGQDSWFDFDKAKVGVNKRKNAYVGVQTRDNDKRGVLALFAANLNERTVVSYHHQVFARTDDGKRICVTHFKDGKPEQPYQRVFLERDGKRTYVVTEDNQRMRP